QGADAIEQVVARDLPMLAGDVVNGRTQVLVIRAAGIAPHPIIDDASAAIDPGPILHLVGNPRSALGPTIGPVLSDEDMLVLEAAGGRGIAEADNALARHAGVALDVRGKYVRASQTVPGRNQEGDNRACGLRGDGGAEDTVAGDGIARRAVVDHRN